MRRRALLSAVAASTVVLSGCLTDARRRLSGRILARHSQATLRPADEQWVVGGLSAGTVAEGTSAGRRPEVGEGEYARAVLFPEAPPRDAALFTDAYPREEYAFEDEILNEDYENGFTLLYEVKMAAEEAFVPLPQSTADAEWTGWDRATLPMEMSRYDRSQLDEDERGAEELVAVAVTYYESDRAPSAADVELYDEAGNRRGGSATAEAWSPS